MKNRIRHWSACRGKRRKDEGIVKKCWRSLKMQNWLMLFDGTKLKPFASPWTWRAESTGLEMLMTFDLWSSWRGGGGWRLDNTSCLGRLVRPSLWAFLCFVWWRISSLFSANALQDSYSSWNNFPNRGQMELLSLDIILSLSTMRISKISMKALRSVWRHIRILPAYLSCVDEKPCFLLYSWRWHRK